MRRLNLAYGPTIMAGAYLGTYAFARLGIGALPVALLVVAGAALAGLYVERLCFRPFGEGAAIASMISSFAVWMQSRGVTWCCRNNLNAFPTLIAGAPSQWAFRLPAGACLMLTGRLAATLSNGSCTTPASASLTKRHRSSPRRRARGRAGGARCVASCWPGGAGRRL